MSRTRHIIRILACCAVAIGAAAVELPRGLWLVHDPLAAHAPELADPSPPQAGPDGSVEVFGSAPYCLRWPDRAAFERGDPSASVGIDLRWPGGAQPTGAWYPWDLRRFRLIEGAAAREVLIGGCVDGAAAATSPQWPADNIRRRLYLFHREGGSWLRALRPLLGDPLSGWVGHSYGGNLFQPGNDDAGTIDLGSPQPVVLFYERVSAGTFGPRRTDIFMRTMRGESPSDDERVAVSIGDPPWPATRRSVGGWLVEGARPCHLRVGGADFFVLGFSSGDYPTDGYGMDYAWSASLEGPYHPRLTADGGDLRDLAASLKRRLGLSWVGRPSFFQNADGAVQVLFHGVWKDRIPDNDYRSWPRRHRVQEFARCIFRAAVAATVDPTGSLVMRLALDDAQ